MKNLLIASSILAMTAGFAAADTSTTFGGSLAFGLAVNGTKNDGDSDNVGATPDSVLPDGQFHIYSTIDLVLTIEGQSDNGLNFGTSIDIQSGPSYDLANDDGFNDNGDGTWSAPAIFVTGSWGTVTFKSNDIDFYDDSAYNGGGDGVLPVNGYPGCVTGCSISNTGDFKYEGTWGGFFVGLITDIETGDSSAQVGYNLYGVDILGDYSMDANPQNPTGALWNVSFGYNWQNFTFSLGADNDTANNNYSTETFINVGVTDIYGVDAWVQYNNNSRAQDCAYDSQGNSIPNSCVDNPQDPTWDVGATYTGGPVSLTASADNVTSIDNSDDPLAYTGIEWTVTGEYALANGVTVQAGVNYTADVMLGAKFDF